MKRDSSEILISILRYQARGILSSRKKKHKINLFLWEIDFYAIQLCRE